MSVPRRITRVLQFVQLFYKFKTEWSQPFPTFETQTPTGYFLIIFIKTGISEKCANLFYFFVGNGALRHERSVPNNQVSQFVSLFCKLKTERSRRFHTFETQTPTRYFLIIFIKTGISEKCANLFYFFVGNGALRHERSLTLF